MVVGAGSSRLTDVIDLRSSIAMSPPEMTLSAATTIGDTAYLSTPVTTEAFDHESGDHTKSPILILLELAPSVPRYILAHWFFFKHAQGIVHKHLVGVGVYSISTIGYCFYVSFPVSNCLNAEPSYFVLFLCFL